MVDELLSAEALLLARGYLYELFHKALGGDPTPQLLRALCQPATIDALDEYAQSDAQMAELRDFLADLSVKLADQDFAETFVDTAKSEFTRLFVGPKNLPAQPFETPYATHEMALFSKNTLAVRHAFKAHGMALLREYRVPDDHVSLMCCFMSRLSAQTVGALREGQAQQLRSMAADQLAFATTHMTNWIPEFAKRQGKVESPVLYPQLGAALAQFVQLDALFLAQIIAWTGEDGVRESFAQDAAELAGVRPETFAQLEAALDDLRGIRLFGLEDCELREL